MNIQSTLPPSSFRIGVLWMAILSIALGLLFSGCSTPAEKAQQDAYKRQKKAYKELEKKRKNFDRESFYLPKLDDE